jgi:hypothetical protein
MDERRNYRIRIGEQVKEDELRHSPLSSGRV